MLNDLAEKQTAKFFAWTVQKTYLSALCEGPTMYMCNVTAMTTLKHLQKNATYNYKIDILVLQDVMRKYHHTYDTITEYIEAIELAQKQSERAKQNITDAMLVTMATEGVLNGKRYLKANNNLEEKDHTDRTWKNGKVIYFKVNAKALLKQKA